MTAPRRNLSQRLNTAGFRRSDLLILALFCGYIVLVTTQISGGVTTDKIILLCILSIFMMKIFYEFTFNRAHIPTMATGFFEALKVTDILKNDAADKKNYCVMDCGSGDGQITRMIAKRIPHATVLGIETAYVPYHLSRFLKRMMGIKNLNYIREDFFAHDCRNVDAVMIFLNGRITELLGEKLYRELKPGAMVITNEFALNGDWAQPEIITMHTPFKGTLFVYRR